MKTLEFGLERLEERKMMAGDVSVNVTGGGDLVMEGDNQGNEVVIRALPGEGAYQIQGINGTTINGGGALLVSNVTDDIRIDLGNGDNRLMLTDDSGTPGVTNPFRIADRLDIRTGDGNDGVVLNINEAVDDVRIRTGGGNDTVAVVNSGLGDRLRIDTSDGNDTVIIRQSTVLGRTDINMGDGDDVFFAFDSQFNDRFRIRTLNGDDHLAMAISEFNARADFDGGNGNDTVWESAGSEANVYADARFRRTEANLELADFDDLIALAETVIQLNPDYEDVEEFALDVAPNL